MTRSVKPTRRGVLLWFLLVLVVSTLGTYFSYHGVFSSEASRQWAKHQRANPITMDVSRVLLSAGAALLIVWNLGVFNARRTSEEPDLLCIALRRYERWIFGIVTTLLLASAFVFQPLYGFKKEVIDLGLPSQPAFDQLVKPYFPYTLYMLGLWVGIVLPVFLVFIRSLVSDVDRGKRSREVLGTNRGDVNVTQLVFQQFVADFEDYFIFLKEAAERYLSVFLLLIIVLWVEQITPLESSATHFASEIVKTILWVFWIPAMLLSVYLLVKVYDDARSPVMSVLSAFAKNLRNEPDKHELFTRVIDKRIELSDRGGATFLKTVVINGRVSVYLLITVASPVIRLFLSQGGAKAIFPDWLINLFQRLIYSH